MALIKMICGAYGLYENNTVILKTPKDEPFEVSDKEAARLVKLEVAEIINRGASGSIKDGETEADDELAYNKSMNMATLSNIALKYGVDKTALDERKTKQQIIDLIDAKKELDEEIDSDEQPQLNDDDGVVG